MSENNYIYVGLISITLSRRLTMHRYNTSSIARHIKKNITAQKMSFRIFFTENTAILKQMNDRQQLQIFEVLHIRKKLQ